MKNNPRPSSNYRIVLKGRLPEYRQLWFEQMHIAYDEHENTILNGSLRDQAEFYGLIEKIRDLGLEVLSIERGK